MKKNSILKYTKSFINRNFRLKVYGFDNEGNTVEQVCHTAQEQGALTDDHSVLDLAGQDVITDKAQAGSARGDVALCGSPTNHTVLLNEVLHLCLGQVAALDSSLGYISPLGDGLFTHRRLVLTGVSACKEAVFLLTDLLEILDPDGHLPSHIVLFVSAVHINPFFIIW